jgi:intracellular septation protein
MSTVFLQILSGPKIVYMMQLLELMPLVAFFAAFKMNGHVVDWAGFHYQFDGIYSATAILMVATTLQVGAVWVWKRTLEKRMLWLLASILVFGSATLLFHNQLFIQWKPTVFNWVLGAVVIGSHLFTEKNIVQRMLGQQLQLPGHICIRLSYLWSGYFFLVGALNLVVAYHFSEGTWVSYKLWSAIVYTLIMSIVTAMIVAPYLKIETTAAEKADKDSPV